MLIDLHPLLVIGEEHLHRIAEKLGEIIDLGDCIVLQGDLGAGKTSFARRIIGHLSTDQVAVISPTFTLVQSYDVLLYNNKPASLWHYDLYRLEDESDMSELAIDDALAQGITIIEWPELILPSLPESRIHVVLDFGEANENRLVTIYSPDPATQKRLDEAHLC